MKENFSAGKESEGRVKLTDDGLNRIEEIADKQKNVSLLFLIEIYRMLKMLLDKQKFSAGKESEGR